jgi:cytochrome c oxidase cbb3-type subunit 1
VPLAKNYLAIFGFMAMVLFGSIYFILPRLTRVDWPSPSRVRLHFFCTALGTILLAGAFLIGGLVQGGRLNRPELGFNDVLKAVVPFIGVATLGWLVLLLGQVVFFLNLCGLLRRYAEPFKAAAVQVATSGRAARAEVNA